METYTQRTALDTKNKVLITSKSLIQNDDTEFLKQADGKYLMNLSSDDHVWYELKLVDGEAGPINPFIIVPVDQIDEIEIIPWTQEEQDLRDKWANVEAKKAATEIFNQRISKSPNRIKRLTTPIDPSEVPEKYRPVPPEIALLGLTTQK